MIQEKYINLFTDYGFKKIFGEEANKDLLIDFLNQVLPKDHQIQELEYNKNEHPGLTEADRNAIFDLRCKSIDGTAFIVELQKAKQKFFKDRSVYYASFPIVEQAQKGEWNYQLKPVFTVGILNFAFDDSAKDEWYHLVNLKDQNCRPFYEKLHFIYLEVAKFTKKLHECESRMEKWLWIFKHLPDQENIPAEILGDMLEKVFKIGEVAKMNQAERRHYEDSLKRLRDLHNVIDSAVSEKEEEMLGLLEEAKAREQETKATLHTIICKFKNQGMSAQDIANFVGISIGEVEKVRC